DWLCTVVENRGNGEGEKGKDLGMRLGLRYVKGLSQASGEAIVRERQQSAFISIDDLRNRVPELRKDEMRKLAAVGALNFIQENVRHTLVCRDLTEEASSGHNDKLKCVGQTNRRDALWQVERVTRSAGELYTELHEQDGNSPLAPMTRPERMDADFRGTGLTIGRHPVAYHRAE